MDKELFRASLEDLLVEAIEQAITERFPNAPAHHGDEEAVRIAKSVLDPVDKAIWKWIDEHREE